MVEVGGDARQVPDAVTVGVGEGPRVDLVHDCAVPPCHATILPCRGRPEGRLAAATLRLGQMPRSRALARRTPQDPVPSARMRWICGHEACEGRIVQGYSRSLKNRGGTGAVTVASQGSVQSTRSNIASSR